MWFNCVALIDERYRVGIDLSDQFLATHANSMSHPLGLLLPSVNHGMPHGVCREQVLQKCTVQRNRNEATGELLVRESSLSNKFNADPAAQRLFRSIENTLGGLTTVEM